MGERQKGAGVFKEFKGIRKKEPHVVVTQTGKGSTNSAEKRGLSKDTHRGDKVTGTLVLREGRAART